jgi:hypothetical protein
LLFYVLFRFIRPLKCCSLIEVKYPEDAFEDRQTDRQTDASKPALKTQTCTGVIGNPGLLALLCSFNFLKKTLYIIKKLNQVKIFY